MDNIRPRCIRFVTYIVRINHEFQIKFLHFQNSIAGTAFRIIIISGIYIAYISDCYSNLVVGITF